MNLLPILSPILGTVAEKLFGFIDNFFPDPNEAAKAKVELIKALSEMDMAELQAKSNIIAAEAQSEGWLARNWRPFTMLTFLGLIVAYWFGFSPPNMPQEVLLKLFDIIQIGIGGYVVGRSAEKVAKLYFDNAKKLN